MSFFGMGFEEIGVILVIALIVFGPGKLPEVMGQIGRALREVRKLTTDLTGEFEQNFGTDLNELREQLMGLSSEVASVSESVKRDIVGTSAPSSTTASASISAGSSTTTTTSETIVAEPAAVAANDAANNWLGNGVQHAEPLSVASKKDPLADVSFMEETVPLAPEPAVSNHWNHGDGNGATDHHTDASNGNHRPAANAATADAVARARQRRQAAGYGRRSPGRPS